MLKRSSEKELEIKCAQLSEMHAKKQSELDNKERQIQHLSKSLRKWTRKYHELELSVSENTIYHEEEDTSENDTSELDKEAVKLKKLLLRLNRRNDKLEKRLEKMQKFVEKMEASGATPFNSDVIEIEVSKEEKPAPKKPVAQVEEVVEPEFSQEMQMILSKHADKCNNSGNSAHQ